jgi:hypothetical protein
MRTRAALCSALLFCNAGGLWADQVEMLNGDRYAGKVLSMTAESVVLQSDVLGKLTLSRSKVASVNLGATAAPAAKTPVVAPTTNQAVAVLPATTNASPEVGEALRHLGADTNFVEQIRRQFLADAGPEANSKYDELVGGLMSGKLDMNSLRAEAKAAADKIRALKQQGGDVGDSLNSYLAILDNFVNQTAAPPSPAPSAAPATNRAQITIITR